MVVDKRWRWGREVRAEWRLQLMSGTWFAE